MAIKLKPKHQRFVDEYLVDLNASAAYIRAGYRSKQPHVDCQKLLVNSSVKAAISEAMAERSKRVGINQDRVLREIAKIAFANMKDFATWTPGGVALIHSEDVDEVDAAAIAEISESNNEWGTTVKIKLHDKKGTLELLGRHLGIFNDKLDVNHKGGVKVVHNVPRPTS